MKDTSFSKKNTKNIKADRLLGILCLSIGEKNHMFYHWKCLLLPVKGPVCINMANAYANIWLESPTCP